MNMQPLGGHAVVPFKRLSLFVLLMFCFAAIESTPAFAGKLTDAVKARDVAQVRSLLAAGEDVQEKVQGDYPLNVAAVFGPPETVVVLLEAGADIERPNRDGQRPLHSATISGHAEIVALLIQKGAAVNAKDRKGRSPLVSLAASGVKNIEIAKMLLAAGADPNIEDENREAALNYTVFSGDVELGKLLIDAHADINHGNDTGEPPISSATQHAMHYEMAKMLIAAGADVNRVDKDGKTPLFYVVDPAMRQLLIEAGAK
jgi:ankyrin repeat protein